MYLTQETIDGLIGRIQKVINPIKVIIFGSAARGLLAADSDIDVLVVVPPGNHRRQTCQRIHQSLLGFSKPVDVIVATPDDLEKHKDSPGLIYGSILAEGQTVYAA